MPLLIPLLISLCHLASRLLCRITAMTMLTQTRNAGSGDFCQTGARQQAADASRAHTTNSFARHGVTAIARTSETISPGGSTATDTQVNQIFSVASGLKTVKPRARCGIDRQLRRGNVARKRMGTSESRLGRSGLVLRALS